MPNDQLALKVFSQKISESEVSKMVDQVIAIIAKQSGRLETEVRKEFQGIQVGEDLADQIINELKKASQILGNKSFNIGADLFKGIFDAKGVEEEINKVVKTFEDKIGALTHLKDQIGDDKIFANMLNNIDTDQLDELIKKTRQLIELEQERNSLSGTDKAKVTRQIKALDRELSASIGQIKIDFNVDTGKINEANEALSKYNVSQEEALKKAKELSKQRNVSSSYIDKDNIDDIKDMVAYMQRYIELVKQAGGSEDEALKKLRSEVGASNVRRLTGASGDSGYSDYKDEIQGVRTEVSKLKQETREIGTGGQLFDESELKKQQQEINNLKGSLAEANAQLDEMRQKFEGLNDPKIIESDEYKRITEELTEAKNRASELQNELDNASETMHSLSLSLDDYNTNELVPKEYFDNASSLIDNLYKKINTLETSLNETEQSFENLSSQLNNLQQDNSSLTEQVSQQKQIVEAQEEQISSLKRQVTEVEELKNNYNELLSIISKLESVQRKAESAIENADKIKAFKDATERVNWNEDINAPEGFVNFDYLEKAKQKLEEVGDRYEKNIKAAVYYHQYLEKGGTERIFNSSGKDVTKGLTSIYSKMESYISKIGDIDHENAVKILNNVNQTLIARREELEQLKAEINLLDEKNKKLKDQFKGSSSSKPSTEDKDEQDNQDKTTSPTSPISDTSKLVSDQKELQGAMSATEQQARETAQAIENVGVSGANQDKTQAEIEETKADVQQLGNEAKETKQNLEDLGKTDANPDIKDGTIPSGDMKDETPQRDPSSIISEQQALENLKKAINSVTIAIAQKNQAIQAEEVQMDKSINAEIEKLKELEDKLTAIRTEFQNGILSRKNTNTGDGNNIKGNINTNENNNITEEITLIPKLSDTFRTDANNLLDNVNLEKDVELKPTYDADTFKKNTEDILAFVDVEKEVDLKVGELNTEQIDKYNDLSSTSNLLKKDFSTGNKKEATQQLREAYKEFEQFYNNQESLATQEGQQAAYKYYMAYKEALDKNVADKTLNTYSFSDVKYDNSEIDKLVNDTKNKLEESLEGTKLSNVQISPDINEQQWIDAVEDIISKINKRSNKIIINPDTSSKEWNDFKTFINDISNKVITLKVNTNVDNSTTTTTTTTGSKSSNKDSGKKSSSSSSNSNNDSEDIKKVNDLLDQQRNKWQEIQNIRIKIASLDPVDDVNEINNLNSQKANLEQELAGIQEEIKAYATLNAQKKASNELDKIASNADKQVNEATLERINKLQKEYVDNLKAQSRASLEIASYPVDDSEKSAEQIERVKELQEDLNTLTNEQSKLLEKINKALAEEQNKSKDISKALSSLNDVKGLDISDVNIVGNKNANDIYDVLTKTSNAMKVLKSQGEGEIFGQAFDEAKADIEALNNALINNNITLTQYNSKVSEIKKNLATQKNAIAIVDDVQISNVDEMRNVLEHYIRDITNGTVENTKFNEGIKTLSGTFKNARGEIQNVSTSIKTLSDGTNVVVKSFGTAQKEVSSFSKLIDNFKGKVGNLVTYLGTFVGFYEVVDAFRQGITYVREFDSALTEMKKVSDETTESLKAFQQASFDIANTVGTTAGDIQNSTAEWMKLGYAIQDASELAQATAIYKNVGDNMDIEGATESMVSTLEGFQLEADQAMNIVDQFNEVSNNFAIDSKGIGDALQRSAASFNAANTGLSESIALITATMKTKWLNIWKHILRIHLIAGNPLELYTTI